MKYFPVVVLFVAFLVAATYAIKADWIRDQISKWTAKANGMNGPLFHLQRWFIGSPLYVTSFRIVAGVVAMSLLAVIIYLLTAAPKN